MKKTLVAICIAILVCMMATLAVASGYTNGGINGKTWVTDSLSLQNYSGKGQDKATGKTSAKISGYVEVTVTISGTDDNGETITSRSQGHLTAWTETSTTATAASGTHAYSAKSHHYYYNSEYGYYSNDIIKSY